MLRIGVVMFFLGVYKIVQVNSARNDGPASHMWSLRCDAAFVSDRTPGVVSGLRSYQVFQYACVEVLWW